MMATMERNKWDREWICRVAIIISIATLGLLLVLST